MRKTTICMMLICIFATNIACSNGLSSGSMVRNNQIEVLLTNEIKNNYINISENINSLEMKDFSVTDGKNNISLDTAYNKLDINMSEVMLDNNYVGEIYSGEFVYKVYMHQYIDFDLYVSNLSYNLKNRDFDEYFITQITLKNSEFKTYRGITVGADIEEVIKAYGYTEAITEDGNTNLTYAVNDMKMQFEFDENQMVTAVRLYIAVADETPGNSSGIS